MEKIYAAVFAICFVLLMLSPIYIPMIIHYRRDKSIKVGNIYIRYGSSKKNPFTDVRQIFKVIDKKNGYIQYEEFKSTHDALNNIPWYSDGEKKISNCSVRFMTSWWDEYECWLSVDDNS